MILHDSTGIIASITTRPFALRTVIDGRGAWYVDRLDLDRLRRYAASLPPNVDCCLDLESPRVIAFTRDLGDEALRRGIADAIRCLTVCRAERPDVRWAWYDSFLEGFHPIVNAGESARRELGSVDATDSRWRMLAEAHYAALKRVEMANDLLAPVHAAQDWICARAYFPWLKFEPHNVPSAMMREHVITWAWREGHRLAAGKPVALLYKPNCQSIDRGRDLRVEHTDERIAEDVAAMRRVGVSRLLVWRDQVTPADRIHALADHFRG